MPKVCTARTPRAHPGKSELTAAGCRCLEKRLGGLATTQRLVGRQGRAEAARAERIVPPKRRQDARPPAPHPSSACQLYRCCCPLHPSATLYFSPTFSPSPGNRFRNSLPASSSAPGGVSAPCAHGARAVLRVRGQTVNHPV